MTPMQQGRLACRDRSQATPNPYDPDINLRAWSDWRMGFLMELEARSLRQRIAATLWRFA